MSIGRLEEYEKDGAGVVRYIKGRMHRKNYFTVSETQPLLQQVVEGSMSLSRFVEITNYKIENARQDMLKDMLKKVLARLPKKDKRIDTYGEHDDFINAQVDASNNMLKKIKTMLVKIMLGGEK